MSHSNFRCARWMVALGVSLVAAALSHAAEPTHFMPTNRGRVEFAEVERISRNHDFNEYRGGAVTLRPYVELSKDVYVGLDETGALLQVIRTPARTIGFLLSGQRRLVDLFYAPGASLVTIDDQGRLLAFDRARWARNPRAEIQRKILASLRWTFALGGAGALYLGIEMDLPWVEILVPTIPISVGVLLQHGLFFAMALSQQNDATDGLRAIDVDLETYAFAEAVEGENRAIADYLLHARSGTRSLKSLLTAEAGRTSELFDADCEAGLARGYPIRMPYAEKVKVRSPLLGRRE